MNDINPPSDLHSPDDFRLVLKTLSGDLSGFDELMRRYQSPLLQFLNQLTQDRSKAEDLVQETFLRAFNQLDKFDGEQYSSPRAFSTWLFTIARRLFVNQTRIKSNNSVFLEEPDPSEKDQQGDSLWGQIPGRDEEASVVCVQKEQNQLLWKWAKRQLTDDQWSVLWLRYAEEYSVKQISLILDKTPGGVKSLLLRAKESLIRSAKQSNLSWEHFASSE